MKKSRYTESQIIAVEKQANAGRKVEEVSHQHGISKSKYGGMKGKRPVIPLNA